MQVELAQLEYMLPRLTRMWTHLEKFRGGIGMRGPGETQLETDRRLINNRIKLLKERLVDVQQRARRAAPARGKRRVPRVARRLHERGKVVDAARARGRRDRSSSRIACSPRSIRSRARSISASTQKVLVTDTVGFIRKLPHHLVASFRATLEEVSDADLLLHVIDASRRRGKSSAGGGRGARRARRGRKARAPRLQQDRSAQP